jgi:hypothetical protein
MASTYLSRTGIGSSNNQKKWTFSGWFKKSSNGSELRLITSSDNSSYDDNIRFDSTDKLRVKFNNATVLLTNRLFRDNNAYYHILVKVDTDQSTANDRIVLYINGVDERTVGGYSTDSMPNQGTTGYINYTQHYIGVTNPTANSNHFNGIMSHVHFTDGYAYDASAFGETDSTTGEWKIKTSPSVSYGTTGFWILKDGNSVTDSSPNSNTFTVSAGTLTKTEDCPSNVFATLNPLNVHPSASTTFANGNNTITTNSSGSQSTLASVSGKFYAEVKISANGAWCGVQDASKPITGNSNAIMLYFAGATMYVDGNNQGSGGYGSAWSANDIAMIAMDLDSTQKKVYFGKNGGWWNGSDYTANAPSTGINLSNDIFYAYRSDSGSGSQTAYWNFGNGYFGSTQISSAGTNASGNGIFEYDVPTGYTALSTKGLNL